MNENKDEVREGTRDCREDLINDICIYLLSCGINPNEAKDQLYILMERYEITNRCTQITVMQTDRNEYLVKKYYVAKTIEGCTKRTLEQYIPAVRKALECIGKTVDDITADDIRHYLAIKQIEDGISKRYADTLRRYLSSFFTYLTNEELIRRNPMLKIKKIKWEKKKKKAFSELEVEKMREAARDAREKALLEFLLSTGCRVTETVNVRIDDMEDGRILIHGKGEKDRFAYLNAKAEVAINAYLKERSDDNPYLFPGAYNEEEQMGKSLCVIQKYKHNWWKHSEAISPERHLDIGSIRAVTEGMGRRAGIDEANPHKFRRTCATTALRRGMSLEQVSKMLGHEELSTTQIYLDLTEDELVQAHKKYVV